MNSCLGNIQWSRAPTGLVSCCNSFLGSVSCVYAHVTLCTPKKWCIHISLPFSLYQCGYFSSQISNCIQKAVTSVRCRWSVGFKKPKLYYCSHVNYGKIYFIFPGNRKPWQGVCSCWNGFDSGLHLQIGSQHVTPLSWRHGQMFSLWWRRILGGASRYFFCSSCFLKCW